ncbi:MAG: neutral/alkaline non-lysosomal ceramidase N-terminal domain-containing protein, partial [Ignavibacteriales bacterium]
MRQRKISTAVIVLLSLSLFLSSIIPPNTAQARSRNQSSNYLIGTGIYDITGPAAEVIMMGYANPEQSTAGIHTRLRSRAFIIADPDTGQRVVIVNADLGQIFEAVKHDVVKKLQASFGSIYDYDNVLLTATHTHNGPGGYSHYA